MSHIPTTPPGSAVSPEAREAASDLAIDIQAGNYTGSLACWSHELTILEAAQRIEDFSARLSAEDRNRIEGLEHRLANAIAIQVKSAKDLAAATARVTALERQSKALRDLIDAIPQETLNQDAPLLCWVEAADAALAPDGAKEEKTL